MTIGPAGLRIETARLAVRLAEADDVDELIDYDRRNAEHLAPWEPRRRADRLDRDVRRERLLRARAEADADTGYHFVALAHGDRRVVASISLNHVLRFALQACQLGYSVDREHEGVGIAFEAVSAVVGFAFGTLRLHRVMASYQPANERSGRLLRRLGFVPEGYARDYLFIDGAWRDHIMTARINPDAVEP